MKRLLVVMLFTSVAANAQTRVGESVNGFPNWAERVILEWMNRARVDPQVEMNACGAGCVERACYSAKAPLMRRTFDASSDNSSPIWSSDGSRIVFGSNRGGKSGIYQKPADGTGAAFPQRLRPPPGRSR